MSVETRDVRERRLTMRSMRRGIKEMDLILTRFSQDHLSMMTAKELDVYDALLHENDHDLYQWVTGQTAVPERFATLIDKIAQTFQTK